MNVRLVVRTSRPSLLPALSRLLPVASLEFAGLAQLFCVLSDSSKAFVCLRPRMNPKPLSDEAESAHLRGNE